MPSNIEIKARVSDMSGLRSVAARVADAPGRTIRQEDVFFRVDTGRLKLRCFTDGSGELIRYERQDTRGAKQSDYQIYRTERPQELRSLLSGALGEIVTVRKKRELFLVGQTRIHLDEVEGLGSFVELEVVLQPGQTSQEGTEIASGLMEQLGIAQSDLVSCAYADLLLGRARSGPALR